MVNLQEPLFEKMYFMLPIAFLALGLLCCTPLQAQDDLNIHGVVSDAMTSAKLADVSVTVMKDGQKVDKFDTRANGKYEFYLSCGFHYVFYFEKAGFVKRSIEIDSRNIPAEVIGAGIIMPTDMSMFAMTPAMEDADLSVFNKPIGKASFDAAQADLVWDFAYTQKVKSEINAFIRTLDKKKKEESAEDKAKAAAEAEFANLVKAGDAALGKENFEEAVAKYRAALDIKADDQNVKAKLGDAETKLNQKKETERVQKAYDEAITLADAAFKSDDFDKAIGAYNDALKVKPNEAYPKKQIEDANRIKKERAAELAKKAEYDTHMAAGDKAAAAEQFSEAVASYDEALGVMPGDKEAQKRKDAAAASLKQQQDNAAMEAQYAALIKKADDLYGKKDFEAAKTQYQAALGVKAKDPYAAERISACESEIKAKADAQAKKEQFDQLIKEGDAALSKPDYTTAISKYEAALAIIADDVAAQSKLKQAKDLLNEANAEKEKKARYDQLIAEADKAFGKNSYEEARTAYTEAREVMPSESYPLDQLNKIKTALDALAAEKAAQEAYEQAMAEARSAVTGKQYAAAIAAFDSALKAKAGDAAATKEKEEALKAKAAYEAEQATEKAYGDAIAKADGLMNGDKIDEAIAAYKSAQQIKPTEAYPKSQIEKAEALLAQRAADKAEAERLATIQKQYDEAIARADGLMNGDKPDEAITAYKSAQKIKPEEAYPQSQIDKAEALLAKRAADKAEAERLAALQQQYDAAMAAGEKAIGAKDYPEAISRFDEALTAKANDGKATQRKADAQKLLDEQRSNLALDEQYAEVIKRADEKYAAAQYPDARKAYEEARALKANESYPPAQLALIDEKEAALAKAAADAELKAKNEQVTALVLQGDQLVGKSKFDEGIDKFKEALVILPDRTDISKKIADAEAAQLAWFEAQAAADAYGATISRADAAFAKNNWSEARTAYQQAIDIKGTEKYPKDQLVLIDKREKEEAAAAEARINALVAEGDAASGKKDYEGAILKYEQALDLAPQRSDIAAKVQEAQNLMREAMDGAAVQKAYDEAIAAADKAMGTSNWDAAEKGYNEASGIKPGEKYPKDKIAEIARLREAAERERAERDALAGQREFDAILSEGDTRFGKQQYAEAIEKYEEALRLKPESETARSKRDAARKALNELDAATADKRAYEDAIADADGYFNSGDYEMAKMRYEDALGIRANEKHPARRIAEIDKILEKQLLQGEKEAQAALDAKYTDAVKRGDAAMASRDYTSAIDAFENALSVKPQEAYPKGQIERAQLLIKDRESEDARLAAEREAAEKRKKQKEDAFATVGTKSEEQAAAFMRDALDAQEKEKYERIKKLKAEEVRRFGDWNDDSDMRRYSTYEELMQYYDMRKALNSRGRELQEQKATRSLGYKRTLLDNLTMEMTEKRVREQIAYAQIKKDAAAIRDVEYQRNENNLDALREQAREMRLFTEEYSNFQRKRNEDLVASGSQRVEREREQFDGQLDERKTLADTQRSKNLEEAYSKMRGDAPSYTEFFRMALALEYPQGVTEESQTMGNKVIITRIVVKGSKGDEYRKVLDRAGNYYFKNGQSISELTWQRETLDAFYSKD